MVYHKTTEQLLSVLDGRIAEHEAELSALKAVAINGNHKTLTNRAVWSEVDGVNTRIGDYLGINKALFVSYSVKYLDGHTKYESSTINAYSYDDEQGKEIGSNGMHRISRTITPVELQAELDKLIAMRKKELELLNNDAKNAAKLVREFNAIADKVNAFEDQLTWATRSVLKVS